MPLFAIVKYKGGSGNTCCFAFSGSISDEVRMRIETLYGVVRTKQESHSEFLELIKKHSKQVMKTSDNVTMFFPDDLESVIANLIVEAFELGIVTNQRYQDSSMDTGSVYGGSQGDCDGPEDLPWSSRHGFDGNEPEGGGSQGDRD